MQKNKANKVWVTPDAEKVMGYCARVSNPSNQDNPNVSKLLTYCAKNSHWSVFEMASLCVEITTSRAISAQILRHRSFSFQEFSQRYAEATEFEGQEVRRQDTTNRQNSINDMEDEDQEWFKQRLNHIQSAALSIYNGAIRRGIAKECARAILPLSVQTRLYMVGSVRSWIHYIELRTGNGTQAEHKDIAFSIKEIFKTEFPTVADALGWKGQK